MTGLLNLRTTIVLCMLVSGVVPMAIASLVITSQAGDTMRHSTLEALSADVELRTHEVQTHLQQLRDQVVSIARERNTGAALVKLARGFGAVGEAAEMGTNFGLDDNGRDPLERDQNLQNYYQQEFAAQLTQGQSLPDLLPADTNGRWLQYFYISDNPQVVGEKHLLEGSEADLPYDWAHANYHAGFLEKLERYGYYDILLVEPEAGHVVYSVVKNIDYASSVFDGAHSDTGLAKAAQEAMSLTEGGVVITDFAHYTPAYGQPTAFIASPVFAKGQLAGVVVVRMPVESIGAIMALSAGLGESGEALILGADKRMRSQSHLNDTPTILAREIDTRAIDAGLTADRGVLEEVREGVDYLTAYQTIGIPELDWTMIATVRADEANAKVMSLVRTSFSIACISLVGVGLLAWFFGRRIYRTLGGDPNEIRQMAKRTKQGELVVSDDDDGRVGAYGELVGMRERLREVLREAARVALVVKEGAVELAAGSQGLRGRTEQQAEHLSSTTSHTEELTQSVRHNSTRLREARELAAGTRNRALESGSVATRAVDAMSGITDASEKISEIVEVIDALAFQTNLLALNAAVEAARAGEQGRGFAVVAGEVRQLAGRSAEAATQINKLISNSVARVHEGTVLVQESGEKLADIVQDVSTLTDIVAEVSTASDKQASGIEQINDALLHLDAMTQQNALMVDEATRTSASMNEQSAMLSEQIGYFLLEPAHGSTTNRSGGAIT